MTLTFAFGVVVLLAVVAGALAVLKLTGSPRPLTEVAVLLLAIAVIVAQMS
jgi:hypothetical protein